MGSENFIGVVSGGCEESDIGQDHIMGSLNFDSGNSSKTVNNSSSRQCIICLDSVDTDSNDKDDGISSENNKDLNGKAEQQVDDDSTETGNGTGTDFELCDSSTGGDADEVSLLKLLNIKVQIPFPSQTQRQNVKSTSQGGSCSYYCPSCTSRNKEISSLFSQMDEIRRKLTRLKDVIELDIKDSFERTVDADSSYSGCINPDNISDRNEFLRYHIAKSFNFLVIELPEELDHLELDPEALLPDLVDLGNGLEENNSTFMDSVASDDDNDEWKPEPMLLASKAESPNSVSDPEADGDKNDNTFSRRSVEQEQKDIIPNHTASKFAAGHTNLNHRHGLQNEARIRLDKLPLHILALYNKPTSTVTEAAAAATDVHYNSNNSNIKKRQLRSRLISSASVSDQDAQWANLDTLKSSEEEDDSDGSLLEKWEQKRRKLKALIIPRDPKLPPKPLLQCFVEGCKCSRYFVSDAERKMHMMKVHKGARHPRGRASLSNPELEVDVKPVDLGEFSHICHLCGKAFTSIDNLNAHIPQHTHERPFKCETCLHSFKVQSGLIHHRRTTHATENERNHYCNRCGKGFVTAANLKSHVRCEHIKMDPAKLVKCEICGKRFTISKFLTMHMKVHRNQGKQLGSGDSPALNVSQDTKPCGIPPKKVAGKGTSKPKPNARRTSNHESRQ